MKLKNDKTISVVSESPEEQEPSGILSRVKNSFFAADMDNIGNYLLETVVYPSCKDLASNLVDSVLGNIITMKDILIYGETKNHSRNKGYTNYSGVFRGSASNQNSTIIHSSNAIRRGTSYDLSAITYDYLDDAKSVLNEICSILLDYDAVTVANFLEASNLTPKPIDYKWGWTNLATAKIRPIGSEWYIDMPKPIYLE